jgi:hypothetical protein
MNLIAFDDVDAAHYLLERVGIAQSLGPFLGEHLTEVLRKQHSDVTIERLELLGICGCSAEGMQHTDIVLDYGGSQGPLRTRLHLSSVITETNEGPGYYGLGVSLYDVVWRGTLLSSDWGKQHGSGGCSAWCFEVQQELDKQEYKYLSVKIVSWSTNSDIPGWSEHQGIRVEGYDEVKDDILGRSKQSPVGVFYLDNGWIGGDDGIFFPIELPSDYSNEQPHRLETGEPGPGPGPRPKLTPPILPGTTTYWGVSLRF